jgi:hypothetical protein
MENMYARKVRRKCSIRGCRCTESFAISKTREIGNSVIICKNCLKDGLVAIDEIKPKAKTNIPKSNPANIPSLFFNAQIQPKETVQESITKDSGIIENEDHKESGLITEEYQTQDAEEVEECKCPDCGKVFDSERGLKSHQRYCDGKK